MQTKYSYWLPPAEADRAAKRLKRDGRDVFVIKKAVCIPLSDRYEIGVIPPSAWRDYEFCRRQYSWHLAGPLADKTLLVSSLDLAAYGLHAETVIIPRPDFKPPRRATEKDLEELLRSPRYLAAKPKAWDDLAAEDPEKLQRWLKIMKTGGQDFAEVFRHHAANHANFIDPKFTAAGDDGPVPYSIGPTARVCSACLEFYNIVGRRHPRKLVVPCPGAVLFAGLPRDTYFEVRSFKS